MPGALSRTQREATCRVAWVSFWTLVWMGCAHGGGGQRSPSEYGTNWLSTQGRSHPLVGSIWGVREGHWVDASLLDARLQTASWVLLGETHDNPDHHRIQAALLRRLAAFGRRPVVAFEMLDGTQQSALDAARGPDDVAQAVGWEHSGWPDYRIYRPIFEVAYEFDLRRVAANLPASVVKEVVRKGPSVLPDRLRSQVETHPLSPGAEARLRAELLESHCGHLPESMLPGFIWAQRARDAAMAESLRAVPPEEGGVLIAGAGHVRRDQGVPTLLSSSHPESGMVSVGLLELTGASPSQVEPERVASFDYVLFTPGFARPDPCAQLQWREPAAPSKAP